MTAAADAHGMSSDGVRSWATEPAFVDVRRRRSSRRKLATMPADTLVLFTAHSLPQRIVDAGDPYPDELRATAAAVAERARAGRRATGRPPGRAPGGRRSRGSGPTSSQVIDELAAGGRPRRARRARRLRRRPPRGALRPRHRGPPAGRGARLAFDRTACVNDDPAVMAALAHGASPQLRLMPRRRRRRRDRRPRRGARAARPPSTRRSVTVLEARRPARRQDPHVAVRRPRRPSTRAPTRSSPGCRGRRRWPASVGLGDDADVAGERHGGGVVGRPARHPRRAAARHADRRARAGPQPPAVVAGQAARRRRAAAAAHRRSDPTRSAATSAPASATRCTSASSTRSSAASTPPTPTTSASPRCRRSPSWPTRSRSVLLGRPPPPAGADRAGVLRARAAASARSSTRSATPGHAPPASTSAPAPRSPSWPPTVRLARRRRAVRRRRAGLPGRVAAGCWLAARCRRGARRASRRRRRAGDAGRRRRRLAAAPHRPQRLPRAQAAAAAGDRGLVRLAEVGALARARQGACCASRSAATGCRCCTCPTTSWSPPRSRTAAGTSASTCSRRDVRVSRLAGAFPQYRPHHAARIAAVEAALAAGLALAGASYHGIGIPACVRSGPPRRAACCTHLAALPE